MKHKKIIAIIVFCGLLWSCKDDIISHKTSYYLTFSQDTVFFDTIFTDLGSATRELRLYNHHSAAVEISRVWFASSERGEKGYFQVNIDGESRLDHMPQIVVFAHDSAYLFVNVYIDPSDQEMPVIIEDDLYLLVNGNIASLHLEAIGQNVVRIRTNRRLSQYETLTLDNRLPYLIFDTVEVKNDLTIRAGGVLYMHDKACIMAHGNVSAQGSLTQPIRIRGDRFDSYVFNDQNTDKGKNRWARYDFPYAHLAGQWDGIYLICDSLCELSPTYHFDYVQIISGNVGLYCSNEHASIRPSLHLSNAYIHNHTYYGVILDNVDASIYNTEISNSGYYGLFCYGSQLDCNHSTIANYFVNSPNYYLHTGLLRSPAVFIGRDTLKDINLNLSLTNNIITSLDSNSLRIDSVLKEKVIMRHNYLRCDSFTNPYSYLNVFMQGRSDTNSVFVRKAYDYENFEQYFDFHLDSLSPARGIGDTAFTFDRDGNMRKAPSDAGCYEYVEMVEQLP